MADRDYYVVLGIPRGESPSGIRRAFRDLARRHHPDRAGPGGAPAFREVVEAYRVLSDPEQRREYDAELLEERVPVRQRAPRPAPAYEPIELFDPAASVSPSAEALLERILRNFAGRSLAKAEQREPLFCDIALEHHEAQRGGVLPIRIPIVVACPRCHGAGHVAFFPCAVCETRGEAPREVVVPLEVPAGVRSGTILEAPLDAFGIRNLWLRARIRVAPGDWIG